MKCSLLACAVAMSTIALTTVTLMTQPASAQPSYVDEGEALDYNQAGNLTTKPATINNNWVYSIQETNNFQQFTDAITVIREDKCRKIDPDEILKNPGSFFRECPIAEKNQTPEQGEKIQYFQVPKLDSGIKLQVTQF